MLSSFLVLVLVNLVNTYYGQYTRVIRIKQGALKGIISDPITNLNLKSVEQFLGIPYASPPIGEMRFMPPGTAPPWNGLKIFDKFGPACPQNVPDIDKDDQMSIFRKESLRNLLPFLRNQSEDCLYLNIYAPKSTDDNAIKKLPLIVYIHGESYEWNSGNPYDASVLASYANVIVITFNYRLGILGFMRMGLSEQAGSNFGLKDQIAALLWLQENIAAFGGDPNSVTLMGHSTGAALTSFLTLSPVSAAQNLFHRAILLSGTALSDWALGNPDLITMQVAMQLNCPINEGELAACMRKKRLNEILKVASNLYSSDFTTRFGPVIDGSVIPNDPAVLMEIYNNVFSRYDMIYGVTEMESFQLFNDIVLIHGMLASEANAVLRTFLEAKFRFEYKWEPALASILNEYDHQLGTSLAAENRNIVMDVLSDGRVLAPIVQMGSYHCEVNPRSYFYVFGHVTTSRDYNVRNLSAYSDELPYIFGIPLDGARFQFRDYYTSDEKLLSEKIIKFFANFAYSGNPNSPVTPFYRKKAQISTYWPPFNNNNRSYLYLGLKESVRNEYREHYVQFWNKILPEVLKNQLNSAGSMKPSNDGSNVNSKKYIPYWLHPTVITPDLNDFNDKQEEIAGKGTIETTTTNERVILQAGTSTTLTDSWTTLNVIIFLGILLLLINVIAFAVLYSKRKSLKNRERHLERIYETTTNCQTISQPQCSAFEQNQQQPLPVTTMYSNTTTNRMGSYEPPAVDCSVIKLFTKTFRTQKSHEVYESVDLGQLTVKKIMVQSSPTSDKHFRVKDWISHELVQKYSPRFIRRKSQQQQQQQQTSSKCTEEPKNLTPRSLSPTTNKTEMISVAIDATPATRSNSILRQEPIELTKMKRSATFDSFAQVHEKPQINHSHSKSEPVSNTMEMLPMGHGNRNKVMALSNDQLSSLKPEELLHSIMDRKYPKVLPAFPTPKPNRSLSLPKRQNQMNAPKPPPRTANTMQKPRKPAKNEVTVAKFEIEPTTNSFHMGEIQIPKLDTSPIYDNLSKSSEDSDISQHFANTGFKTVIRAGNKQNNEPATFKKEPKIIVKPKKDTFNDRKQCKTVQKSTVRVQMPSDDEEVKKRLLNDLSGQ